MGAKRKVHYAEVMDYRTACDRSVTSLDTSSGWAGVTCADCRVSRIKPRGRKPTIAKSDNSSDLAEVIYEEAIRKRICDCSLCREDFTAAIRSVLSAHGVQSQPKGQGEGR